MHPAPSIVLFTVLSGLGYGLAAVLGLGILDPTAMATKVAHLAALALIAGGLLASTFHLGNPQRAWRALTQWRSSWLSREGVFALATFLPLCWAAWMTVVEDRHSLVAGLLGAAGCAATVWCTSMIYASLKSIDAWHTPLTTACFMLFSLSGGLIAGAVVSSIAGFPAASARLSMLACVALAATWLVKWRWRGRLVAPTGSTPETATGLGPLGKVRLFEPPHMTPNYLTHEMVFRIGRKHSGKIFTLAALVGCVLPTVLLVVAAATLKMSGVGIFPEILLAISLSGYLAGTLGERWLFFAEARHAVANYYGS